MKILVSGFNPFGSFDQNPSGVAALAQTGTVRGVEVVGVELPTEYDTCAEILLAKVKEERATHVLMLGMSGARNGLTPETRAYNYANAAIADNAGVQREGQLLTVGGQAGYAPSLDPPALVEAVEWLGLKAKLSGDPGTFVCNNVAYRLAEAAQKDAALSGLKFAFCHTPTLPDQNAGYAMPQAEITAAVRAMVQRIISEEQGFPTETVATVKLGWQPAELRWFRYSKKSGFYNYMALLSNVKGLNPTQTTATDGQKKPIRDLPDLSAEMPTLWPLLEDPEWGIWYDTQHYDSWILGIGHGGKNTGLEGTHPLTVSGIDIYGAPFKQTVQFKIV